MNFLLGIACGVACSIFISYISKNIKIDDIKSVHEAIEMIHKNQPNVISNWMETFKFFYEQIVLTIEQKIRKSCIKIDNNYHISFIIENKVYKLIIKPIRGPDNIIRITNENEEDITNRLIPYIHGIKSFKYITPKLFSYKGINIYLDNEMIDNPPKLVFKDKEIISGLF